MTVLTKCDLLPDKERIDKYVNYFSVDNYEEEPILLKGETNEMLLYAQIRKILNSNDLVSLRPLNLKEEDSIRDLLLEADQAIQFGENAEPNDKMY